MNTTGRWARWVTALAMVATLGAVTVASAGPAAAAAGCRQATPWTSPDISWDVSYLDTDGRQDVAVWRTAMFRASTCDQAEIYWEGWGNTGFEDARVRVRTYYENGDLRVDSGWRTIHMYDYVVLRRNINTGVRIRFDVHHPDSGRWSGRYPPDQWTYVNY